MVDAADEVKCRKADIPAWYARTPWRKMVHAPRYFVSDRTEIVL
jgi:hypothetical protein